MGRYYPGLAGLVAPDDPHLMAKLIVLDSLIPATRQEEAIREHELTPDGVYRAVLIVTGGTILPNGMVDGGDVELASSARAKAEAAEQRMKGN